MPSRLHVGTSMKYQVLGTGDDITKAFQLLELGPLVWRDEEIFFPYFHTSFPI